MRQAVAAAILLSLALGHAVRAKDNTEAAGDVLQLALPATALGLALGLDDHEGLLQFGKSAALTLGATYGLKYAIDEERPDGGRYSFPSGHTSISFASAEFLRKRYGWRYGLPAYGVASFVGYSRVEADRHYTHDVIAGAAIGIASSYLFTRPYHGWSARIDADAGYCGISLCHRW